MGDQKKAVATIKFFTGRKNELESSDTDDDDPYTSAAAIGSTDAIESKEAVPRNVVDTHPRQQEQSTSNGNVINSSDQLSSLHGHSLDFGTGIGKAAVSAVNPFEDFDAVYDGAELSDGSSGDGIGRDIEESIYNSSYGRDDLPVPSYRARTDSSSNLLMDEKHAELDPLQFNFQYDHFGVAEDWGRMNDINTEIEKLKQAVFMMSDNSREKGNLIERLIALRLRRDELQDRSGRPTFESGKTVYGHDFRLKESSTEADRYCEVCCSLVWGVIQSWYTCFLCHICIHDRCLNGLKHMCVSVKVAENPVFNLAICPDQGLMTQNYKCFECRCAVSYKVGCVEPRLCDYTGNYFCPACHWNDEVVIPARIVQNWDFELYRVSRSSKHFLKLMQKKPVLAIVKLNPHLPSYVEELKEMQRLREEILMMKVYFLSCQLALQNKLLLLLGDRQHFVENSDFYSLYDLMELVNERLIPKIVNVHATFATHIKVECDVCKGKGYFCEICGKSEILFPFDNICVMCKHCSNVYHKHCFAKCQECPKCARLRRRQEDTERKAELLRQIELTYER